MRTRANVSTDTEILDFLIRQLEGHVVRHRHDLIGRMKTIGAALIRRAEQLEQRPEDRGIVNGLGELQGNGPALDIMCSRYDEELDLLLDLRAMRRDVSDTP